MSVRRFLGSNSRDAMRLVRAALGDDALILSNRRVEEGVEILAMADDEHGRLTQTPVATQAPPASTNAVPASASTRTHPHAETSPSAPLTSPAAAVPEMDFAALSQRLLGEMQDMRALLNRQEESSAAVSSAPNITDRLRHRLWAAGIGPRLAAELLTTLPPELDDLEADEAELQAWLKRQLASRLLVPEEGAELLDDGGVIALVGPTGIGKTTTTAKLAARYVMRHGSEGVVLVTTDSYRVGAHEQLRIYARLLGVEVHALDAETSLESWLAQLGDKRLVIIDTVGMSQRDQRLVKQVAQLGGGGERVRLLLLLNAASHGDTLEDVIATYRRAAQAVDSRLIDCILTKSDEAARLGPLLDTVIRHGLRLHYVSHGQRVPEDLSLADARELVDLALDVDGDSPFALGADDLEGLPKGGQGLQSLSRGLLGQGRSLAVAWTSLREYLPGFALLEDAWEIAASPGPAQQSGVSALQEQVSHLARQQARASGGQVMLWGPSRVSGCDWPSPIQALDPRGRLLALSWQYHMLPAGQDQRLGWTGDHLGIDRHLLAQCPDIPALEWLCAWQLPWLTAVKGSRRVAYEGERRSLSQLAGLARDKGTFACRAKGRHAVAELTNLAVEMPTMRREAPASILSAMAWFCRLTDADSGQELGRRYWLSSDQDDNQARELLLMELAHVDLPSLTRLAWQRLGEAGFSRCDSSLRLMLAGGLAAVAMRLDQDDDAWAMDVRSQLLSMQGGKAQRKPKPLLEALLHLFTARDVFRQMGRSGQRTFGG
ncbi:flagellar biosynthesis protein [Litchfieldella qijiaojingensis]|uniref:Flagellar biosynthesis protein FlhF n=1 Tax=Litchfieldella qijiaojingensis TaxID=980347 RepID=A0ABQ2YEW4_9GAMM|nr:flagellar biosynthesis protein FlhF [Halomonas qijiaojingensis]GGX80020.1 flagellar biosynthesis protein [Halomonas qijiaojingensis]